MSQAFYTSMGGINASQTTLNVVANNIANMNTTAFKSSKVNFADLLYNSTSAGSGSAPTKVLGGTNPQQVGLGVQVSAVKANFNSGAWQSTGNSTDLFVNGEGFFTVYNEKGEMCYTRDGNFTLDGNGNMVTANGYKVIGGISQFSLRSSDTTIKIPTSLTVETIPNESDIAAKELEDLNGVDLALGTFYASIKKTDLNTNTSKVVEDIPIDISNATTMAEVVAEMNRVLKEAYDDAGFGADNINVKCDATTGGKLLVIAGDDTIVSLNSNSETAAGTSNFLQEVQFDTGVKTGTNTTYSSNILDYKQTIDYSAASSGSANFTELKVYDDGAIEATYSNGDKLSVQLNRKTQAVEFKYTTTSGIIITGPDVIANPQVVKPSNLQIQLANFVNKNGLIASGNNIYKTSANCGDIFYGTPGGSAFGNVTAGGLEGSNVDLAQEFSEMILAQKAIQANSRVFSTTNDILETIAYLGN